MDAISRPLACPYCDESFKRPEHLDRHLRRHSGTRPFSCDVCSKAFSRRDTLKRHSKTHGEETSRGPTRASRRSLHACTNCAEAKERCDGASPCQRCGRKELQCKGTTRPSKDSTLTALVQDHPMQDIGDIEDAATDAAPAFMSEHSATSEHGNSVMSAFGSEHVGDVQAQDTGVAALSAERLAGIQDGGVLSLPLTMGTTDQQPVIPAWQQPTQVVESLAQIDPSPFILPPPGTGLDVVEAQHISHSVPQSADHQDLWSPTFSSVPLGLNTPSYPYFFSADDFDVTFDQPSGTALLFSAPRTPHLAHTPTRPDQAASDPQGHGSQPEPIPDKDRQALHELHLLFPPLDTDDHDIVVSEDFCHVEATAIRPAYQNILTFFQAQYGHDQPFAAYPVFHAFIQLYFEHLSPVFPFLHPTALEANETSWLLALSMAAAGSQYSAMNHSRRYEISLQGLLWRAMPMIIPEAPDNPSLSFVQSVLLFRLILMFGGTRATYIQSQYVGTTLGLLCRSISANISTTRESMSQPDQLSLDPVHARWRLWVQMEGRKRLVYTAWSLECLAYSFYDIRPSQTARDLDVELPCHQDLWSASNAEVWEAQVLSRLDTPRHLTLRTVFSEPFPAKHIENDAGRFTQIVVMLSLFVEEQTLRESTQSWLFQRCLLVSPASAIATSLRSDSSFEIFLPQAEASASEAGHRPAASTLFHLLSIIRQVNLKCLYTMSGWQSTPLEAETAHKEYAKWVRQEAQTTRKCLWHAASIFSIVREQKFVTPFDPFALLIAALFLWGYTTHSDIPSAGPPLRLNRTSNITIARPWIEGKQPRMVHVDGIGILAGDQSPARVLKGLVRVLSHSRAWPQLSHGIQYAAEQLTQGLTPTYTPD